MACSLSHIAGGSSRDAPADGLRRSFSSKDLQRRAGIRRSYSDNHLGSIKASSAKPKLKTSRSVGFFNLNLSTTMIPDTLRSLLFDPKETKVEEAIQFSEDGLGPPERKKWANWVELRDSKDEGGGCDDECEVENDVGIDREVFSSLLSRVSWSDTKKFSRLAFLCNMAYVIPHMKVGDLRRYYGLEFVTSSLDKKEEAKAIKDKAKRDSTKTTIVPSPNKETELNCDKDPKPTLPHPCSFDQIAASYVQSQGKEETDGCSGAACVAASTVTAVAAAPEREKEKAARDLRALHSSPCEWFVCDDPSLCTRCFVIQGSDSLASWQTNLFFEPTKFEGTDVLVHRGIYEAANGIYDQFVPEIRAHLEKYGDRARLQFTGHSLGGSLALLVNLMLLSRNEVGTGCLLPVITFGSPFVFCMGQKILERLGLDEDYIHCVLMHRDIVPRAFSCNYPDYVARVLKRLNHTFRHHPCLTKNKLLYTPMGKIFILQPDENSSPPHPLLPPGQALYTLNKTSTSSLTRSAIRAFLNSPHPIETLSDPAAYGSEGTILRDHDSSNYLKAMNEVIRQHTRLVVRKARKQRNRLWLLLASGRSYTCNVEGRETDSSKQMLTRV